MEKRGEAMPQRGNKTLQTTFLTTATTFSWIGTDDFRNIERGTTDDPDGHFTWLHLFVTVIPLLSFLVC